MRVASAEASAQTDRDGVKASGKKFRERFQGRGRRNGATWSRPRARATARADSSGCTSQERSEFERQTSNTALGVTPARREREGSGLRSSGRNAGSARDSSERPIGYENLFGVQPQPTTSETFHGRPNRHLRVDEAGSLKGLEIDSESFFGCRTPRSSIGVAVPICVWPYLRLALSALIVLTPAPATSGRTCLQEPARQVRQLRALTLSQSNVSVAHLPLHAIDQIGEPVALGVEVGRVDLEDVAREHHLGAFPGSGDDGLDLVWAQVLGFVDDEDDLRQAASSDIRQRRDVELVLLDHCIESTILAAVVVELVLDDVQVVPQWLHVWVDLRRCIARQIADVTVGERHDRPRQIDLSKRLALFDGARQSEQGLAGSGGTGQGDQRCVAS